MAGKTSPVTRLTVAKLVGEDIRPTAHIRAERERETAGVFGSVCHFSVFLQDFSETGGGWRFGPWAGLWSPGGHDNAEPPSVTRPRRDGGGKTLCHQLAEEEEEGKKKSDSFRQISDSNE